LVGTFGLVYDVEPHESVNNCNGKMRIFAEVLSGGTSLRCGRSISCEELWERMVYPPHRYLERTWVFERISKSLFWKILRAGESNQWYPQVFLFEGLFRYIYYTIFRFTATNLKTLQNFRSFEGNKEKLQKKHETRIHAAETKKGKMCERN